MREGRVTARLFACIDPFGQLNAERVKCAYRKLAGRPRDVYEGNITKRVLRISRYPFSLKFFFFTSICAKRFKAAHSQNGVTDCVVENIRILRIGKTVYRSVLVNAENFCGFNNGQIIRYTAFQLPVYLLFVQRRLYFASLWYLRLQKRLRLCFQIRLYSQSFACCVLVPRIYRILSILPGKFSVLYRVFLHMHKRTDA